MFLRFTPVAMIRSLRDRRTFPDRNRTPADRRPLDRSRARFRLEGLEERCLLSGISGFTEFPVPSGNSTYQITPGPDGNLWFTEWQVGSNKIGMINPTTHAISEFTPPTANSRPYGITAGPDGNVWFTEWGTGKIGMINPTTHAITEFTASTGFKKGITTGPDGNLWFAGAGGIGEINPTTHVITSFPVANATCHGITAGPDGNVWFTEDNTEKIGVINPITHAISQFSLPSQPGYYPEPSLITTGPDGNLWFTEYSSSRIGMINPTTHAITEFANPAGDSFGITTGTDANLWFGTYGTGRINTTTDGITVYPVPATQGITTGPDGNLWFTDGTNNGVATLAMSQLVVTPQPPASVTAGSPFGLTVQAEDSSGNLLSSFNGTVTVALATNPGGDTLGGTLTANASNGVATFSGLSLTKALSGDTLVVSGGGFGWAVTNPITVTTAAAAQIVITQQPPASVTAGSGFGLQATIEDSYGNVETSASNAVSVALANNPTGATLGGTLFVTASQGVASFSGLSLTTAAAGYTLQVSSSGLSGVTSNALTVTPAAATQVAITQQPPSSVVVNSGFGLLASVEDAYGNVVTSATNTVKVALASNPGGAKLGETLSVKASKGVAAFSGMTLNKVGTGYTLQVTSSGLGSVTSSAITVTNATAIISAAATVPANAPDPLLAPLVLDSPDLLDGAGIKKHVRLA